MTKALPMLTLALAFLCTASSCTKNCKGKSPEAEAPVNGKTDEQKQEVMKDTEKEKLMTEFSLKPGEKLFATFDTSRGEIKAELFWEKAPKTVLNFVELAQGKREWVSPEENKKTNKPLYDGTIFHRVIKGFMIQGGDPLGSGMGGPGYRFSDEFHPELRHDKKGTLSMANSGRNTNGSQFFITDGPTPHLNDRHSVFGQVHDNNSLDVISTIASVETAANDRPQQEVKLKTVRITKE